MHRPFCISYEMSFNSAAVQFPIDSITFQLDSLNNHHQSVKTIKTFNKYFQLTFHYSIVLMNELKHSIVMIYSDYSIIMIYFEYYLHELMKLLLFIIIIQLLLINSMI